MKKKVLLVIILCLICTVCGVYAGSTLFAKDVTYTNSKNTDVTNVDEALDDLYDQMNFSLSSQLTELVMGTATIENNTEDTIYAVITSYTNRTDPETIVKTRIQMSSVTGASYEKIFQSYNSANNFGVALYKLTNCQSTVIVKSSYNNDASGLIVLFK